MKVLSLIPARGGSKRIPQKNIRPFLGQPIIAYSIQAAIKSGSFDEIMVSTDDSEIARIAEAHGAQIPFLRSKKNADDYATTADVIKEVLTEYEKVGKLFDFVCCIYPTAPFVNEITIRKSFEMLIEKRFSSVFPVVKYSHPIQRALEITDGTVSMIHPENLTVRSQDLQPTYHDAGQYYWLDVKKFNVENRLFMKNSGAIILDEMQVQDIDTETDWELAELKYRLSQKK